MTFTDEDKIFINNLFNLKGSSAKHLVSELPSKGWNVCFVYQLLETLQVTGWVRHCSGSSRWRSTCTTDKITLILLTNWCYAKMDSEK